MKFSVGYQLMKNTDLLESIIYHKADISEVYFSFGDFPNGRGYQLKNAEFTLWQAQERQINDLKRLCSNGIPFNLLFNAMCYGAESQSRTLYNKIGETVEYIQSIGQLNSVTTTSPLIAQFIKENFDGIDVRASINMSIGTIEGMKYVEHLFDSFYLKRELNRDFNAIKALKDWCDMHGKKLHALANSGCLNYCSAHIFHDNLVSHEKEIATRDNGYSFEGICRTYLNNEDNRKDIFKITNFIRPEDTELYESSIQSFKLATRVNQNPLAILDAYISRKKFNGNILDLLEPNHSGIFYPEVIENRRIRSQVTDGKLIYDNIEIATIELEDYECLQAK